MTTSLSTLRAWVEEVASRTQPDQVVWCDGSDTEYERLIQEMLETGTLSELNQETIRIAICISPTRAMSPASST